MASKKTHHKTSDTCAGGVFSKPWKSSDLVLSVEDRKFHVHRTLLAVASPVFERMFSSDFKEKNACEIPLPGKTADNVEELLKYIYPGQVFTLTRQNCFSLFMLATEYQIEPLREQCEELISDWCSQYGMDTETSLKVLVLSQMFPLKAEIINHCATKISNQTTRAWSEMKQDYLFQQLKPELVERLIEERMESFERRLNVANGFYNRKDRNSQRKSGPYM